MNLYDQGDHKTIGKLVACYGPDRAVEIVAGRDPAANADLAAWRRLGGLAVAPRVSDPGFKTPTGLIMTYAARGVEPKDIAKRFGVSESKVIEIIEAHA